MKTLVNTRYDQKVTDYVVPVWQDETLMPQSMGRFIGLRDRYNPRAHPIDPAAKPVHVVSHRTAQQNMQDNSIYSNSPHWSAPWLLSMPVSGFERAIGQNE